MIKLGTYNTAKTTLPQVHATHGSYIHVSAILHYRGLLSLLSVTERKGRHEGTSGTLYQAVVSARKAAVDALSQVALVAVEEGPHGICSNVIALGPIGGTEGMDRLSAQMRPGSLALAQGVGEIADRFSGIPVTRLGMHV